MSMVSVQINEIIHNFELSNYQIIKKRLPHKKLCTLKKLVRNPEPDYIISILAIKIFESLLD